MMTVKLQELSSVIGWSEVALMLCILTPRMLLILQSGYLREAVMSSHSRCVSRSMVANIKWFNIKSWTGTFKDNACSAFTWLDTWLINWRSDDASPFLTWAFDINAWHASWQSIVYYCNDELSVARQQENFHLLSVSDRLCGLVVRVSGYRYRGPGFDPWRYQIFWVVVGLERGPLSLVRSNWGATWIKK